MTDEEWMLDGVLRLAPWLDISVLRDAARTSFREYLKSNSGRLDPEFVEDTLAFCDGKRALAPRSAEAEQRIVILCTRLFPECADDDLFGDAADRIYNRLMEERDWSRYNRGRE